MSKAATKMSGLNRVLDALATRLGLGTCIAILVAIGLWASFEVEEAVDNLEGSLDFFQDSQRHNGFVAISDLQRLLIIASEAWSNGAFDDQAKDEFVSAVDILFVRTDHFNRVLQRGSAAQSGRLALEVLEEIIALADTAIADDFSDPERIYRDLQSRQEMARSRLVAFLEDVNRLQDSVLEDQSVAISHQRLVVNGSFVGLVFIAALAFFLLRREVLARKAHQVAEQEVQFLAYFDPLTRLANRTQFQRRLDRLLAEPVTVALLLLDLDNFKSINDTHGHAAGDRVLTSVAGILDTAASVFKDGFAARLGGDEFAIVLPEQTLGEMRMLCDRLLVDCGHDVSFDGEVIRPGVSIGLATTAQVGKGLPRDVDSLTRATDFALYAAKNAGRGRYEFYNEGMERKFLERRNMIEELPDAIRSGALDVYLQPKVHLPHGAIYGFEALVRWNRGDVMVPPDQFVSVAEESGLILELDRYVMRVATQMTANINADLGRDYSISVNLSALHFSGRRIVGWVQSALMESRLPPSLLTLEITESVELGDWRGAQATVEELRESGTRVSIDDIGTGYSSIGYLHAISADELKIDRSLVEQIETCDKSRFLVDTVLDMAGNLNLDVVVEGIETESQARVIHALGGTKAQGYLFGRPMPEETMRTLLRNEGLNDLEQNTG